MEGLSDHFFKQVFGLLEYEASYQKNLIADLV